MCFGQCAYGREQFQNRKNRTKTSKYPSGKLSLCLLNVEWTQIFITPAPKPAVLISGNSGHLTTARTESLSWPLLYLCCDVTSLSAQLTGYTLTKICTLGLGVGEAKCYSPSYILGRGSYENGKHYELNLFINSSNSNFCKQFYLY